MMRLVLYPDPLLRNEATRIDWDTADRDLLYAQGREMVRGCADFNGIGLAANQVGSASAICVIAHPGKDPVVLVNPVIVEAEGSETHEEGCLSVPGWGHHVTRAARVSVAAETIDGVPLLFDAEGLEARIVQHEVDHLNGRLIVDHGTRQAKRAFARWYEKQTWRAA